MAALFVLTWSTFKHIRLRLTSSRVKIFLCQILLLHHLPPLPLPPVAAQERNYSDHLALFVGAIITFRSAKENTDQRCDQAPALQPGERKS